jgi:hypothetical protein
MRQISKLLIPLLIFIAFNGCQKPCDKSLRIGEIVQIPIQFNGFSVLEIDNILVYRIDNSNTSPVDTFLLRNILWANMARSTNEIITDRDLLNQFGYYGSYFDNSTLILDWHTGRDTLLNIEIKKSQENIKGCHENDPNVKIDRLTFIHKGKSISKDQSIQIDK